MGEPSLRPTGLMERYFIARNHVNFYNIFQVSATYTIPRSLLPNPTKASLLSIIYSAIGQTIRSHPTLNVIIADEGTTEPAWKHVDTIDLQQHVRVVEADPRGSPDEWMAAAHRERLNRVDEIPPWRVVLVVKEDDLALEDNATLTFTLGFLCHHGLGDGLSSSAFHLTFLDATNRLISNPGSRTASCLVNSSKIALLPSLEESTSLSLTLWFTIKAIIEAFIYAPIDPKQWTGPNVPTSISAPPIINMSTFFLPPTTVASLVSRCRANDTTLTLMISVLVARKLALLHPEYQHFTGSIPFSLRKFSGHTQHDMGVFISSASQHYSSQNVPPRGYASCASTSGKEGGADEPLWSSARTTKDTVVAASTSITNTSVGLLKYVSDYSKFFLGMLGTKRKTSFEVTNIGVVDGGAAEDGKEKKAWFDRVVFSSGMSTCAEPYCVSVVSAKGGEMCVALGWESEVVKDVEARELSRWLEEQLWKIGGDDVV